MQLFTHKNMDLTSLRGALGRLIAFLVLTKVFELRADVFVDQLRLCTSQRLQREGEGRAFATFMTPILRPKTSEVFGTNRQVIRFLILSTTH